MSSVMFVLLDLYVYIILYTILYSQFMLYLARPIRLCYTIYNIILTVYAVFCTGYLQLAEYLIDHGLDINAANKRGFTSLHIAARDGALRWVQM